MYRASVKPIECVLPAPEASCGGRESMDLTWVATPASPPSTIHSVPSMVPSQFVFQKAGTARAFVTGTVQCTVNRHRGEPGHTHGTHGRTRAHGSYRRTSQPSKPTTHEHTRTTIQTHEHTRTTHSTGYRCGSPYVSFYSTGTPVTRAAAARHGGRSSARSG